MWIEMLHRLWLIIYVRNCKVYALEHKLFPMGFPMMMVNFDLQSFIDDSRTIVYTRVEEYTWKRLIDNVVFNNPKLNSVATCDIVHGKLN